MNKVSGGSFHISERQHQHRGETRLRVKPHSFYSMFLSEKRREAFTNTGDEGGGG